jgi:hypothetical protein
MTGALARNSPRLHSSVLHLWIAVCMAAPLASLASAQQLEGGMFGYERAVYASSASIDGGNLPYASELFHNDGPFKNGDGYRKANGVLRYGAGDSERGWNVTGSAYAGAWDATEQIAERALNQAGFDRFDTLNPPMAASRRSTNSRPIGIAATTTRPHGSCSTDFARPSIFSRT